MANSTFAYSYFSFQEISTTRPRIFAMFYLLVSYGVVENLNHGITTTVRPQNGVSISAMLISIHKNNNCHSEIKLIGIWK